MTTHPAPTRVPAWRSINISRLERAGRILIGLATIAAAVVLMLSAGSPFAMALETLLVIAGADLVITGALGHCPLYAWLGRSGLPGGRR
mgnify:CR=1 FL=1